MIAGTIDYNLTGNPNFEVTVIVIDGKGQSNSEASTTFTWTVTEEIGEWAAAVVDFSSQWSDTNWSAQQAIGAPDTTKYGEKPTAWSPFGIGYGTTSAEQYITVLQLLACREITAISCDSRARIDQ